jgi:hypothetical protein
MKEKRDIQKVASEQANYLDRILDPKDIEEFKKLIPELKDTWVKKQMFRTETEMRFSVLNDAKHPTNASKYWQSVREQNTHFENLIGLSFDARKNDVEIKKIKRKLKEETDDLELELLEIELDQKIYQKANMELMAKHRMREVKHWSELKKELVAKDPDFDTKNVDTHQLHSYGLAFVNKKKTITPGSSQPEVFNVLGQAQTIERIQKEEKEKLSHEKKEQITK